MPSLSVAFVLEETSISGIASLVLAHADSLVTRGHKVTIWTPDAPLSWRSSTAEWRYIENLHGTRCEADVAVVTSAASLQAVIDGESGDAAALLYAHHPDEEERREVRRAFDALGRAYPHIIATGSSADPSATGPDAMIVSEEFFDPGRRGVLPRVLITGAGDHVANAIDVAYATVADARWHRLAFTLVRLSRWAPPPYEPVDQYAEETYIGVSAIEAARVVTSCDIVISASAPERGLRVSIAEALAAGLAPVMAGSGEEGDDEDEPGSRLGACLRSLLVNEDLREEKCRRARKLARPYHPADAGARFEAFLIDAIARRRAQGSE